MPLAPLWGSPDFPPDTGVRILALLFVGAVLLPFLLGSIPFGLILTRLFSGVDVRSVGSGNIGATNVARAAGRTAGILTLLLDASKGAAATFVDGKRFGLTGAVLAGLFAFLGHVYSPYLRFKGGKGVATAVGVFAVLTPWGALAGLAVYGLLFAITRISAVGSLGGSLAVLVAAVVLRAPGQVIALCAVLNAIIVWRHRKNLAELWSKRSGAPSQTP